jgi:transcriptional regulator with XRE-family HTH domain
MGRETSLRDLVDRNLKAKQIQPHPDLAENFHWNIQRIRRNRKITKEEFAKGIGESESTVRMIEQGFIPENNYKIISKIESYLGISLRKPGTSGFPDTNIGTQEKRYHLDNSLLSKEEQPKELKFDGQTTKQLKISDLKEMKKRQQPEEDNAKKQPSDSWEEEYSEDDEKFLDEKEEFDEEDI